MVIWFVRPFRICPGRYMADNSVFIAIATILQLFDISPPKDGMGNDIQPVYDWTSGLFSYVQLVIYWLFLTLKSPWSSRHPTDFKCTIRPRSKASEQLILESMESSWFIGTILGGLNSCATESVHGLEEGGGSDLPLDSWNHPNQSCRLRFFSNSKSLICVYIYINLYIHPLHLPFKLTLSGIKERNPVSNF